MRRRKTEPTLSLRLGTKLDDFVPSVGLQPNKLLSHLTGLVKWMESEQSQVKSINVSFLYIYHLTYPFHVH